MGERKKYVKCMYFYGSRQMYFCGDNISIEMQKELAYTPPLTRERKKIDLLFQRFEKYVILRSVLRLCNDEIYEYI